MVLSSYPKETVGKLTIVANVDHGHRGVGSGLLRQEDGRELIGGDALEVSDARHGARGVEKPRGEGVHRLGGSDKCDVEVAGLRLIAIAGMNFGGGAWTRARGASAPFVREGIPVTLFCTVLSCPVLSCVFT